MTNFKEQSKPQVPPRCP